MVMRQPDNSDRETAEKAAEIPRSAASERAEEKIPHVVIVGGGFAGLQVARGLRHAPCRVTVIDRANHHLFQPLLYQVATAALAAGEIAQPIRHILRDCRNATVLLAEVTGVDTAARLVRMHDGNTCRYDVLVLAAGATHGYFGHPEWAEHAPGLKSLDDARRIRNRILLAFERAEKSDDAAERKRLMRIAVIGGGPTGVEMAGAIAELTHRSLAHEFRRIRPEETEVVLFEAGPRILTQLPDDLADYATRALRRLGVQVRCNSAVEDVQADSLLVAGDRLPVGTIVWAAGVAVPPLGQWLGTETDRHGRIKVGRNLAVPGLDRVFVLGDAAHAVDDRGDMLPGLAQVAHQQGRHLGRALRQYLTDGTEPPPFHYRSRGNLATIGRNAAVVQFDRLKLRGFIAWLLWGVVHVFLLIGFENRMLVAIRWLWAYLTAQRSTRLIMGEPKA